MKVTVYLHEARGSYCDGFDKKTSLLVEGFEFDNGRDPVSVSVHGRQAGDDALAQALDEVFVLLNVGGDLYPHTEWSAAYRAQDRRSLSKGDVVVIDGYGFFAVGPVVGQEGEAIYAGFTEIAGGAHWVEAGLARHIEHFGDAGIKNGVMA